MTEAIEFIASIPESAVNAARLNTRRPKCVQNRFKVSRARVAEASLRSLYLQKTEKGNKHGKSSKKLRPCRNRQQVKAHGIRL